MSEEKKFNWEDIGYTKRTENGHTVIVLDKDIQILKNGKTLDVGKFRNKIFAFDPTAGDEYAAKVNMGKRLRLDLRPDRKLD